MVMAGGLVCGAAVAVAALSVVGVGGGVTSAAAEQGSPWSVANAEGRGWGDGREFVVRQWRHAEWPGWVFVEATLSTAPTVLRSGPDGSVSSVVGEPGVSCDVFGQGRQAGSVWGSTVSGGWWVREGVPVECTGDLGSGQVADVAMVGMRAGGSMALR